MSQDRDLQARLAKGERGIPKIPDSPDTRHAVAAPPAAEGQAPPRRNHLGDGLKIPMKPQCTGTSGGSPLFTRAAAPEHTEQSPAKEEGK